MILIPSPHFSSVPKFNVREGLYEDKFVLFGFILHSLATEKELRNTLETAFMDKFAFTPVENKFEFVRAVEKKIVKIRSTDEITAEVLKNFCGSGGPIYIRSTTDLTALLTNQNLLKQDPNSYYPTLDELDEFYGEQLEEATTMSTTQSSTTVSAVPVSSIIAFEIPVPTTISDVPINEMMGKFEGMNNAESQKMLDVTLEDFDERFETGYNKMDIQLDNKNDIIEKVTRHFAITRQLEEINFEGS